MCIYICVCEIMPTVLRHCTERSKQEACEAVETPAMSMVMGFYLFSYVL